MKIHSTLSLVSLLLAFTITAGCSGTGDVVADGKAVTGVDVTPDQTTMSKGTTLQLKAVVQYADGTSKDVTADESTVWNTSDATIASVTTGGLVTAVDVGAVDVSADYKGEKGNEHFGVSP